MLLIGIVVGVLIGLAIAKRQKAPVVVPQNQTQPVRQQLGIPQGMIMLPRYTEPYKASKYYFDSIINSWLMKNFAGKEIDHWEYTKETQNATPILCSRHKIHVVFQDGTEEFVMVTPLSLFEKYKMDYAHAEQFSEELSQKGVTDLVIEITQEVEKGQKEGKTSISYPTKGLDDNMIDKIKETLINNLGIGVKKQKNSLLIMIPVIDLP